MRLIAYIRSLFSHRLQRYAWGLYYQRGKKITFDDLITEYHNHIADEIQDRITNGPNIYIK
jgi:hypothetical protein